MKTPSIEHHEFRQPKETAEETDAKAFYTMALLVLPTTFSGLVAGNWTWRGIGIATASSLATVLLIWLLSRGDLLRDPDRRPLLRIGPQGIRSWSKLSAYIPWHRISLVEPQDPNSQSYEDFTIMIDGPNLYSHSVLVRLFDNAVVRPLGGRPRFTVSFKDLEADPGEVAALVRRIVAAAKT